MCLGEEAPALRCLGGLGWLDSQCPISPTGPMSSETKAASCWCFLLTGQKLLESLCLPALTPSPASQPRAPSTALPPAASSLPCLVTSAEPRTDLGVSGEQAPKLGGWERGRSLPLWAPVSPNAGVPWKGWGVHLGLTEYLYRRKKPHVRSLEGLPSRIPALESRAQGLDTVFDC